MENPLKTGLYATVCRCNNKCSDIADWSLSLYIQDLTLQKPGTGPMFNDGQLLSVTQIYMFVIDLR